MEWSLPAVFDIVSDVASGRDMLVWKGVRRTFIIVQDNRGTPEQSGVHSPLRGGMHQWRRLVQLRPGATLQPSDLREFAALSLARFKAPRWVAFCAIVRHHASGKPDYQWAHGFADAAVSATQ